jgi:hypothetical protein
MKCAFAIALTATMELSLAIAAAVDPRQSSSFVKTSGQKFTLDGNKFTAVGVRRLLTQRTMTYMFNLAV